MGGAEVLPLVEGGKGVSATNGQSSGAWAHAGGVGTVSAVNADSYDENGQVIPQIYHAKTRRERHEELVAYGIAGGIAQIKAAHEVNGGRGRIHANILWEMGGAERIIRGMLEAVPGMIHGVTCGAGMPYGLAAVAREHHVFMYPIVSSARAFNALWRRAYSKASEWLGGVVYEDPWLAGGHNGLSNSEDPRKPEDPFPRVLALRQLMNSFGLNTVPIIMAGGVWWLEEWEDWIDNPDLGPIAFQFGTRPLLTKESPIPDEWKQRLLTLKPGDVSLQTFSPTGFYSSAVRTRLLRDLEDRSERQVAYAAAAEGDKTAEYGVGPRKRPVWMTPEDRAKLELWVGQGFTEAMRTPDDTLIFETPEAAREILQDQTDCMGCLSHCRFSNWTQIEPDFSTGKRADPRSFCIQKKLQAIAHGGGTEDNLMFAGQVALRFAQDPFYSNGFIPTAGQLVERILTGR